jgi:L-methionine (R)-S-oxide reductase
MVSDRDDKRKEEFQMDKIERYETLLATTAAMVDGETDPITVMSTISCELFQAFGEINWAGFYRRVDADTLKVGPYQGGHGCLTITLDRGVCGKCAKDGETQIISDVNALPYHIACSSETRSEVVVPLLNASGEVTAVLDVDSPKPGFFDALDAEYLGKLAELVPG